MKTQFIALKEAISFFPDTVIIVDEQANIVAVNDHVTNLFGYHPHELKGQKLSALLPQRIRHRHDQHFRDYLAKPEVRRMGVGLHLSGLRKDGTEIDVDIALAPVVAQEQNMIIATVRDVTEKKELERKLLRKNEQLQIINDELEKFGYLIAHDLKSPLINLHAVVHLMTKELSKERSEKLEEYISAVQGSLESMTNMISGVSAYSSAGIGSKQEEDIDLNQVMAEVRKLLQMPKQGSLEVEGQLPCIKGNKTKVLQVFMNLVCNAFKHNNNEAPRVVVKATQKGGQHLLCVADNGPGVPAALRKNIFRLFDKGNSSRTDSQGIGLSIVKKLIEERGGSIEVNDGPLGGAEFIFTWPGGTSVSLPEKKTGFTRCPYAA